MTPDAIRQITKEMKQYQSPELNEKLYLHFKGWKKIEECLGAYTGVRALWLEGNGLRSLDNMGNLKDLRCLYIHQNCLETLEGLEDNVQLDAINASNNAIKTVSHVSHLKRLNTLQVAHNRLTDLADVEHLAECKTIGVLDISNNKLEDPAVVDVLAKMDNLHVLQMQGNPVTRKIQHYRKTVVARCQKLTYLDDRPVFEDERRTVTAWARGGAGHKVEPNADGSPGELSAVALYEALSDGTFDKNKAHEAEKEERKNIREEKEERERRNREAFREMMLDARVRRVMQILPNTRLLKDVSEAAIEELAHRVCQNPVHTNEVVGLAKDEAALHAGTPLGGLYIITRGRLQMQKSGKPVNSTGGGKLASGQYFGEVALCTAHDQIATADMVCVEYSEIYCLTKEALMEVADLYEGTMDVLQANRAQALRCQWHECKPWQAYDLVPSSSIRVDRSKAPPGDDDKLLAALQGGAAKAAQFEAGSEVQGVRVGGPSVPGQGPAWSEEDEFLQELAEAQQSKNAFRKPVVEEAPPSPAFMSRPSVVSWYAPRNPKVVARPAAPPYLPPAKKEYPKEWYGKHELAQSVQVPGDEDADGMGQVYDSMAFGGYNYYEHYGAETGMKIKNVDEEFNKQRARVEAARQKAFKEEAERRGCTVEEVEAETAQLKLDREKARKQAAGTQDQDDLPPLEDVEVSELGRQATAAFNAAPLAGEPSGGSRAAALDDDDGPPDLEDVDVSAEAPTSRSFYGESDEQVLASTGGGAGGRNFKTQYEKDNHATQGEYNRELEASGDYNRGVSSKTEASRGLGSAPGGEDFEAAATYGGSRKGFVFKMGAAGLGYYKDLTYGGASETSLPAAPAASSSKIQVIEEVEAADVAVPPLTTTTFGDGGIDDLD